MGNKTINAGTDINVLYRVVIMDELRYQKILMKIMAASTSGDIFEIADNRIEMRNCSANE